MNEDDRYSIKDFLDRVVMVKLDGIERKLDSKADTATVNALELRVKAIEDHGSREAVQALMESGIHGQAIERLERWRNRTAGALVVVGAEATAAVGLLLKFHHHF